jgi:hypothetical protein
MRLSPTEFLGLLVSVTIAAMVIEIVRRRRRINRLQALATQWRMHYSTHDPFHLAPRVAQLLPIPGAAAVRVTDLIYGIEGDQYRYIFTAEFTTGVIRTKARGRVVASFTEPRDPGATRKLSPIFAPERLESLEQYRHLHEQVEKHSPSPGTPGEGRGEGDLENQRYTRIQESPSP